MNVLLIFIDGFGIGDMTNKFNPFQKAETPTLDKLCTGKIGKIIKTDVTMGIPGLPQSATGQTALLTGENAATEMGRHKSGYPDLTLKNIIYKKNIFKQLEGYNIKTTFANAYTREYVKKINDNDIRGSVTTHCVLNSENEFRFLDAISSDNAIYQDFTNKLLQDRGFNLPTFSPQKAAKILSNIVLKHNFTLYEYFQTDKVGHDQNIDKAVNILEDLDLFISELISQLYDNAIIIISSDHGNIEDLSTNTHTRNPVPTIIIGNNKITASMKKGIEKITDITPVIISHMLEISEII